MSHPDRIPLYDRASISPHQLIAVTQQVLAKWPNARLHKSDVTKNLRIIMEDELVGQIDLLSGELDDFTEDDGAGGSP